MSRVVLALGPSRGGIGRHVASLATALCDRGWDASVVGPWAVRDLGFEDLPFTATDGARLRPLLRAADLVHAHGLTVGWRARLAGARPLAVTVHNTVSTATHGRQATALRPLQQLLPRAADAVVCVSDEIAATLGSHPRLRVIPPYVATPVPIRTRHEVRRDLDVAPDAPLVVVPSRLHPQKGLDVLVAAAARVHESVPAVRFFVAGEGPAEADVRAAIAAHGAGGYVTLLGFRNDVVDLMVAADAVALASVWEGSPLSVQEAMALGVPVVATAVGGIPSLVTDRVTGRLVPPREPSALADALVDVLRNRAVAQQLGAAGARAIERLRGPEATVTPIEALYRELLACG